MAARVIRTRRANADLVQIARWTIRSFGPDQARRYVTSIEDALAGLRQMPELAAARPRPELGHSIWTIRAGLGQARSRHILLFAYDAGSSPATVTVLRILHDAMDPARHTQDPA